MKKNLVILGSTGSIGRSLLKIISKDRKNFNIILLSANKNFKQLLNQTKKFNVKNVIINNEKSYEEFKKYNKNKKLKIYKNFDNLQKIFKKKIDYTMSCIVGLDGLEPTFKIIKYTKKIAIANKESIICGWELLHSQLKKNNTEFIPVDSEHFSLWYGLQNINKKNIESVYLTASGGPFFNLPLKKFNTINIKKALQHPNWKMGKKISIDSSTLMNKILELAEAEKFFNISNKKLDILIHPESLVHAVVEFNNGLIKFIYHKTSMIIPLANAIFEKNLKIDDFLIRKNNNYSNININNLTFKKVDQNIFPIITLKNRISEHPSTPIIINASNEVLVDLFLSKKITFLSIYKIIMTILGDRNYKKYAIRKPKNINQIIEIDMWARNMTLQKALLYG